MQKLSTSLKWLEVFQLVAQVGSIQQAAKDSGLSTSTVSHHLQSLQQTLGVQLFDLSRRPLKLTGDGVMFLRAVDQALHTLRKAEGEAKSGKLSQARLLRIALVEDFDSDIGLALSQHLAAQMPKCEFTLLTRPSHDILGLLRRGEIDIGVAMEPKSDISDIVALPLLRDPFVLALPKGMDLSPEDALAGHSGLPFLRYSKAQFIGGEIEAQLRRLKITLPKRFEIESNHTLLGTVADGTGWTITTPASFMRARRFHDQIKLCAFPGKDFARTISVMTGESYNADVTQIIADHLKHAIQTHSVAPALRDMPWLRDQFFCFSEE